MPNRGMSPPLGRSAAPAAIAIAGKRTRKPIKRSIGIWCALLFLDWELNVSSMEARSKGKNILERALSVFAPVHRGEATTALLMMVNVFVLLTAYYLIKP